MKVSEVAADYLAHGSSVEEMMIQFRHLSSSMIHVTSAYYYDHREAYEKAFAASLKSSTAKATATATAASPLWRHLAEVADKP